MEHVERNAENAEITGRYGNPATHHGDCLIFTGKCCDCGLLHDLSHLNIVEAVNLYPRYIKEVGEE